jgi:hypothetical protein
MPAPEVQINILDPGLGIVPASAGKTQVKLGAANKGTPGTVYSISSIQAAKDQIGSGPMLDAIAQVLSVAGGSVLVVPLTLTADGTVTGAFALTGTGSGTVIGSRGPEQIVKVKIILGGTPGTMTYQVAIGSGAYSATITSTADPYTARAAGQNFTKLVFANITYIAGDVYQLNLDGTVTRTGTGGATALDGSISSPIDAYDLRVQITASGALATSTFRYSLDGGNNWSASVPTPAAGKYVIPGSGVVLTFAGTFTVDDLYQGAATTAGFGNAEVNAGYTALRANSSEWGFSHVVGTPASAAAAASLAGIVSAAMTADEAGFRYGFAIIECPQTEGDSTAKAAFASFVDLRVEVRLGDIDLNSPLTGRRHRRNNAWAYAARLSKIKLSTHPGKVEPGTEGGPLKNVVGVYPLGDNVDMDANRFGVVRTIVGAQGFYVMRGRMMAPAGSDFAQVMNRRVMDRICTVSRAAFILYLNSDVRIDPVTKFINELDALRIEKVVRAKLRAALMSDDEASSIEVALSRSDNLLSTSTLNAEVQAVPKAYLETIKVKIGFVNPLLA